MVVLFSFRTSLLLQQPCAFLLFSSPGLCPSHFGQFHIQREHMLLLSQRFLISFFFPAFFPSSSLSAIAAVFDPSSLRARVFCHCGFCVGPSKAPPCHFIISAHAAFYSPHLQFLRSGSTCNACSCCATLRKAGRRGQKLRS